MALENRHRRLSEQVLDELKRLIVRGVFSPNSQLSEVELSKQLGVSRTPVREALIRLAEDGLVNILPQVGTFVSPISIEGVQQAQFIREHLECAVVAELAKCIDEKILQQLRLNLAQQVTAALQNDWETFYDLDEQLHSAFASACGHAGVWRVIQQSKTQLDRVRHMGDRQPGHGELLVGQHTGIIDAIAERNPVKAQELMRAHLREVFSTMREFGIHAQN
jgi:DNA-binding GntR family transcriptional regulator